MNKEKLKWYDRKRIWCGLPWTFTRFGVGNDRIFVECGLLNLREYEVRLYRITNINLTRSLVQRIFGLGTIHVDSNDKDLKCFNIKNVKDSIKVKEMISESVERERTRNRVSSREYMSGGDAEHDDPDSSEDEKV